MTIEQQFFIGCCFLAGLMVGITILYLVFKNPFSYPYYVYQFNVTGKRNVKIEDYIDRFLCDSQHWDELEKHQCDIVQWKSKMDMKVQNSILKKYRARQLLSVVDDKHAFRFATIRMQTRYRQRNYVKTSYKVPVTDAEWGVSWRWLQERYKKLHSIGFESSLSDYESKNQRRLMTKELRKRIMERDNYICQMCGKYMPDEVGLQIDHIIPIAKGGKSVPSNLRVLCSKCNGYKGAK